MYIVQEYLFFSQSTVCFSYGVATVLSLSVSLLFHVLSIYDWITVWSLDCECCEPREACSRRYHFWSVVKEVGRRLLQGGNRVYSRWNSSHEDPSCKSKVILEAFTLSLEDELTLHLVVTTCYTTKYYMLSLSNVSQALILANKMGNELKEVLLFHQGLVSV